jgi:REP element-mobilizing transposase RayT
LGISKARVPSPLRDSLVDDIRNFNGERFWARGYAVFTVGFEEVQIRAYIKHQEQLDAQGSDESGEF